MKKSFILTILFILVVNLSFGQTTKFKDTGTIKNQFDYLINKSNRFQEYKVVKQNWLHKLKLNVADSLSVSRKEIQTNYKAIKAQQKSIDSLKTVLNTSNSTISNLNTKISSIHFIGIQFNKGVFKTLLLSIIAILILLLFLFITKFKQSNSITTQTKSRLKETEVEFEDYRKRALEREQKVMRKLQDELNKQKKE